MSAISTGFTLADLERMPDDRMRREILRGELIELLPPKLRHANIISHINASLTEFNFDARTWIEPDVSFVRTARVLASLGQDYMEGAPDFAVEVVSPGESAQDVEDKIQAYLQTGAHAVAAVYPKSMHVKLHLADGTSRTLRQGANLSLPDLLPGWELPVADIFAE